MCVGIRITTTITDIYAAFDLGQRTIRAVMKSQDGKIVNELKIKRQADSGVHHDRENMSSMIRSLASQKSQLKQGPHPQHNTTNRPHLQHNTTMRQPGLCNKAELTVRKVQNLKDVPNARDGIGKKDIYFVSKSN